LPEWQAVKPTFLHPEDKKTISVLKHCCQWGPVKNKQLKDKKIKMGYDGKLNDYGYKIKC